ncbi:hypothetical protein CBL_07053 [Carabus blaptoides fortunei]
MEIWISRNDIQITVTSTVVEAYINAPESFKSSECWNTVHELGLKIPFEFRMIAKKVRGLLHITSTYNNQVFVLKRRLTAWHRIPNYSVGVYECYDCSMNREKLVMIIDQSCIVQTRTNKFAM